MTKAQAAGTKASIIKLVLELEERIEELQEAKSNLSEEEMRAILADEIDEAREEGRGRHAYELFREIERGISFADLKEMVTGRIEL